MANRSEVVRRLFEEVWRNRNADVLDEICTPDCQIYDASQGEQSFAVAEYKEAMRRFDDAFRVLDFSWQPVVETEDACVYRWQMRARMEGPLEGKPPTGREGAASGVAILRWKGDRIAEHRSVWDTLRFYEQLGLVQWRRPEAEAEAGAYV